MFYQEDTQVLSSYQLILLFFSKSKIADFGYIEKQLFEEIKYVDDNDKTIVIIGNDCWIGSNVSILGGLRIGDGAIIGANALVTRNVEPYSIVGGIPAKKIGQRFENEQIEFLLKFKWWEKSDQWLMENEW